MATMFTTTRSLLLAGALAFAALPALAQTSPQTQPAAPSTGTTTPGASTDMGTGKTTTTKSRTHTRKVASAHKSNVHRVSTKKHATTSKTQKPTGGSTGTGTSGTQQQ